MSCEAQMQDIAPGNLYHRGDKHLISIHVRSEWHLTRGGLPCAQSYNIIQLFLVANLLTSTSTIPVLAGLWYSPRGLKVVTPFSMLFGCAQSIASLFWWSRIDQQSYETYGDVSAALRLPRACVADSGTLLLGQPPSKAHSDCSGTYWFSTLWRHGVELGMADPCRSSWLHWLLTGCATC